MQTAKGRLSQPIGRSIGRARAFSAPLGAARLQLTRAVAMCICARAKRTFLEPSYDTTTLIVKGFLFI